MNQETLLDMNDLLGESLDDTPDVPDYVSEVPAGNYHLAITDAKVEKYETKDKESGEKEERMRIRITYSVAKTVELADPTDVPIPDGSLFSESFMVNENGKKYFKRQVRNILGADNIQGVPMKDIFKELTNDHTIAAKVKTKESVSEKDGKTYSNVQVHILGLVDDDDDDIPF